MVGDEGWYHCGRCGALYHGRAGGACPECRRSPVVPASEFAFAAAATDAGGDAPRVADQPAQPAPRRLKGLWLFVIGWLVLLVAVLGIVKLNRAGSAAGSESTLGTSLDEQRELTEAYEACRTQMTEFLADSAAEARVNYVYRPTETLGKMTRARNVCPMVPEDDSVRPRYFEPFEYPGGRAFQSLWETLDGREFEMVFLRGERDEWRIDWENLTRYSGESWPLFLAGNTADEAEFRLFARRPARDEEVESGVSLVKFLEPLPWTEEGLGMQSPEIRVDARSETGRLLEAAFRMDEEGGGVFGTRLHEDDPQGMIRLRVRLRREPGEREGDAEFHLKEILAAHWMAIDAVGVEPVR